MGRVDQLLREVKKIREIRQIRAAIARSGPLGFILPGRFLK